jgi:hypothetical protein
MKPSRSMIRATARAHQPGELFGLLVFGFGTEARLTDRVSDASWREAVVPVSSGPEQRVRSGCGDMLFIINGTS